uniref:Uncharacterized protein n=1 Tax=Avena sativa TaxID=4498 RepID=A0ACD5XF55_AVESA
MVSQPVRTGPRQRPQPTPRGVNMIVWSLDNRFVLAAIMDCRICVWNASDGSLVHSLIGHKESTFVLDVHPFNPRIAMSAGYDGKTIIWDIWEGKPVQIYETGHFKLVDGKFSPDGTSLVLTDEIGQIFIIGTGQGESQKDAKYDQTTAVGSDMTSEHDKVPMQHDEVSATNQHRGSDFTSVSRSFQEHTDNGTCLHDSKKLHFESAKTYSAVYTRLKPSKYKKTPDPDAYGNGDSTSISNDDGNQPPPDYSPATPSGSLRRSARRSCAYTDDARGRDSISHEKNSSHEASTSGRRIAPNVRETWGSASTTAGLRSARHKKESCNFPDTHLFEEKHQMSKYPWLMLLEHQDIYNYIPQLGDEVTYLRQGHEEYLNGTQSLENCPWNWIKGLQAAELCKIKALDYKTYSGSGESCCKLTMEFIDHTSSGYGEQFVITLPELVSFPDFLVERTRFEAAITQNWVIRDKCKVWWSNDLEEGGGSWWEGRVQSIMPKSPDFPESPWERYVIQYKNDGSRHPHSPWELHHTTGPLAPWKHPHIDPIVKNKLLSAVTDLQKTSHTNQDCYGVLRLDTVAGKSDFINRFPVQFSIEVIRARLHNDYYRTLEAVKHDAGVMLANAESYFSRNAEMTRKICKLSDWIRENILSL